jgi:hypothetical protein
MPDRRGADAPDMASHPLLVTLLAVPAAAVAVAAVGGVALARLGQGLDAALAP